VAKRLERRPIGKSHSLLSRIAIVWRIRLIFFYFSRWLVASQKKDDRTMHAALPVVKGIKYGANAWFHLRNFKEAMATGCM
jgi:hypothetical protein